MLFHSRKKTVILVILVAAIIILAGLGLRYSSVLEDILGTNSIELQESGAVSGEPTDLHFSFSGDEATLVFPDTVLVARDGIFRNETSYKFSSGNAVVTVLIPPSLSELTIEARSGSLHETFVLEVRLGQDPLVSGESYYQHYTTMARQYNNRQVGSPQMARAAEHYQSYFAGLGYDSEIRTYQRTDGLRTFEVKDVVAFKWGKEYPDEWIVLGGHYDIVRRSIEGAMDNTGGACAVVELAEGMAELETSRTVVFGLWDGEEKGLWGSRDFVAEIPENVDVKTDLNFDMVGLNWPQQYPLAVRIGPDNDTEVIDNVDLYNATMDVWLNYLEYPESGLDIRESTGGGSDHTSFQQAGVQTFFFISTADYIQYHRRTDLIVDMVAYAGGVANLEAGFNTVAWTALYLTLLLDNNDTVHQGEPPS
jgi:hypothetical protein